MLVFITPSAKKQLKKYHGIIQISIVQKLRQLGSGFSKDIKKLRGHKNVYRIRLREYRIVYKTEKNKIYIISIGHRKEVYRLLERFLK